MDLQQCPQGHYYDPAKHSACPFCGVPGLNVPKTQPKADGPQASPYGATRPRGQAQPGARDQGKTIGRLKKKMGIDPVVGWLVCIKGPDLGRDYRIRAERNFIGRSDEMDICIASDASISRERHAVVTYNPTKNSFRLAPGESRGMVCLNEEEVETPVPLSAYDRIQLGESELIFIPFCGESFKWEKAEAGQTED